MRHHKPPKEVDLYDSKCSVFLAGSIEMGKAEDWQTKVANAIKTYDVDVLNPRRDDWDPSWEQSKDNPKFVQQVEWELDGIDAADIVFFYLQPETMSPISLMELGLVAWSAHRIGDTVIVVCPNGFWRKGNVDILCGKYGIPIVDNLNDGISLLKHEIERRLG